MKIGTWKTFYENGNKKEVGHYTDDTYYVDTMWSPEGSVLVENGEGVFQAYDPEGSLIETGTISGGSRVGEWTTYYPQSDKVVMSTTQYANGEPDGLQQFFYEDGTLQTEGSLKDGKREGSWKWYHANATLETTADFKAGKKDGVQNFYLDDGTLTRTEVYKQGELMENKVAL